MNISPSLIEPWFIKHKTVTYNLAGSGISNQSLEQLIRSTNIAVEELLKLSLEDNDTHGSLELRETIATFYEQTTSNEILVAHGTSEALFIYFQVCYRPGVNIVVVFPAFESLYQIPKYIGYEVRFLQLRREDNFRPDLNKLSTLIDENTAIIVLNNPHNPTGIVYLDDEIQTIISLAERYDSQILADEHYRFISYENADILPSLFKKSANIVAVGSIGKCFGCIGLRIGWMVGSEEIINRCRDFKDYTTHTVCSINDFLVQSALKNWKKIVPKYREWILHNRIVLRGFINDHSDFIDWIEPEAGIVAFPFFKDQAINSENFAQELAEESGVLVLPGDTFGMPGHFRICLGVDPQYFCKALKLFSEFILAKVQD